MGWPYEFVTLTDEEKHQRRIALEYYAYVAFLSAFAPCLVSVLVRLIARVRRARRGQYSEVPGSPGVKASQQRWITRMIGKWSAAQWWLGEDVYFIGSRWGQRDEWVLGVAWTLWMLILCVRGTGKDYLHLTKRFGIIATSQMPIQYLLALKALNPFAFILRSSHEHLNRYHRVLGRIIYFLLILHAVFYNIFFFESGIWVKRFFAPVVFAGVVGFAAFHALTGTAMARVREYSYRIFFVTHLVAAFSIPPLIYYHAHSARFYVALAVGSFVVDLAARKITTITAPAVIEAIPGTTLVKVSATMPSSKIAKYRARPGSHVYLNMPSASRPGIGQLSAPHLLFEFLYNPFTVASTDEETRELTLVARTRTGPMTGRLSHFSSTGSASGKIELNVEGPYGAIGKTFRDLIDSGINRVLLVAGGVGATFAVPLYHAILAENASAHVQLIWAIRSPGDATWASSSPTGKSLLDDDQVQLFLTGDMGVADSGVEMNSLQQGGARPTRSPKRPDLQKIVDDTFRQGQGEKVAVLVCGPPSMASELRRSVTPWVMEGREVWWHNESFGW
ncbi:FAD-binding FR-type domain-containing protein [Fusarium falciforme]|uniref:FAD-binding FR-type domain-containing protein n=1 Tax=Fusarium falciforme TaxID=195108 RepID=UPI002300E6C6|nr:FAD-binding FR-type domain-containing protein [Fusarium falciforme]WAO83989.1 FAD-binding FR-type domain-containing protein [Fusarium falciforme]